MVVFDLVILFRSLRIALWALYWSFQTKPYEKIPEWFADTQQWPFQLHGFETIYWVVLVRCLFVFFYRF